VRMADEGTGKPEPGRDAGQQAKHGADQEGSKSTGRRLRLAGRNPRW
jgi:hypothetical protein